MKQLLNCTILLLLTCSCWDHKSTEVERITATPVELNAGIESMMPGSLLVTSDYILWTNPFHAEKNIHILDRKTGLELGQMLSIGEGPDELITPSSIIVPGNRVYALDMNSHKQFLLSVDSALSGAPVILERYVMNRTHLSHMSMIDDSRIVFLDPGGDSPFILTRIDGTSSTTFGQFPLAGKIANGYDIFQGQMVYHPQKGILLYSTIQFPYMALYQKENESFRLICETPPFTDYGIVDGKIKVESSAPRPVDLAFTSDYIVAIQRDPQKEPPVGQSSGRDFSKLPHTICLYDFDLQLKKVIDLGMPVLRLAADPLANTVWFIGVNPDFTLYRCEL